MIKIVLTGPESSGKTTLAQQLAAHFQTNWTPEYARQYIDELDREYIQSDLLEIAKGQLELEDSLAFITESILFCDTDLLTLKIWSDYKYKKTHPWILQQLKKQTCDLYLLCAPDIPWTPDSQRENPDDRDVLFDIYKSHLIECDYSFVEVKGGEEERMKMAIEAVKKLIDE